MPLLWKQPFSPKSKLLASGKNEKIRLLSWMKDIWCLSLPFLAPPLPPQVPCQMVFCCVSKVLRLREQDCTPKHPEYFFCRFLGILPEGKGGEGAPSL